MVGFPPGLARATPALGATESWKEGGCCADACEESVVWIREPALHCAFSPIPGGRQNAVCEAGPGCPPGQSWAAVGIPGGGVHTPRLACYSGGPTSSLLHFLVCSGASGPTWLFLGAPCG